MTAAAVVRFLDDLRAAEIAGAEVLTAWIAVCRLEGLRGGLRVIAERESVHAALLGERLAELAVPPTASVAEAVRRSALAHFGSASVPDEEKLHLFLARYPEPGAIARPIVLAAAQLEDDPETREILRLVAEGESATVAWLRAYYEGLARRDGSRD